MGDILSEFFRTAPGYVVVTYLAYRVAMKWLENRRVKKDPNNKNKVTNCELYREIHNVCDRIAEHSKASKHGHEKSLEHIDDQTTILASKNDQQIELLGIISGKLEVLCQVLTALTNKL